MKPHRGTLILVLGILGLVFSCGLLGIVAWIMGAADLKAMDAGTMDPAGRANTNAGRICGIIATILMGLMILGGIVVALIFFFAAAAGAH